MRGYPRIFEIGRSCPSNILPVVLPEDGWQKGRISNGQILSYCRENIEWIRSSNLGVLRASLIQDGAHLGLPMS